MDIPTLTGFFMWCTILNGGLLLFWSVVYMLAPNLVFRLQTRFFPLDQKTFALVFCGFLGVFKIFVLVFNLVPWLALLIMGRGCGTG
jgi:hypothetical protein